MIQRKNEDPEIDAVGEDIDVDAVGTNNDILHPETDELVEDCKKLFERAAVDTCGKMLAVHVVKAVRQVIDGFAVKMVIEVSGASDRKRWLHAPTCWFEIPGNNQDASLMQMNMDPA